MDPIFRFTYHLDVDVPLAEAIAERAAAAGLQSTVMRNPDFRVDYGTLTSCHLARPTWDVPIVVISSARSYFYFSNEVGDAEMLALGAATREAIEASGRKAVLLASCSLSHRHFTEEPEDPEDPRFESIYNANQRAWDDRVLDLMRAGDARQLLAEMPDFIEQSVCKDGSLTWLLGALGVPSYPAVVHGYGTVIGTGNAIVQWTPPGAP